MKKEITTAGLGLANALLEWDADDAEHLPEADEKFADIMRQAYAICQFDGSLNDRLSAARIAAEDEDEDLEELCRVSVEHAPKAHDGAPVDLQAAYDNLYGFLAKPDYHASVLGYSGSLVRELRAKKDLFLQLARNIAAGVALSRYIILDDGEHIAKVIAFAEVPEDEWMRVIEVWEQTKSCSPWREHEARRREIDRLIGLINEYCPTLELQDDEDDYVWDGALDAYEVAAGGWIRVESLYGEGPKQYINLLDIFDYDTAAFVGSAVENWFEPKYAALRANTTDPIEIMETFQPLVGIGGNVY